ncbi:hypothetical protein CBS14141_003396 [Malassezia furfur]|nr:hypothetical protein CBS14141_003396 [Malassezia furfur]
MAPDAPPGGAKRAKYTPLGMQASALERLMQNPDKPVKLPEPTQEKSVRPPPDMVPNVNSSTAGAGSGEFHVYTQARQREYERLGILAEKAERHAEFRERQEQLAAEDERKTSKNRARREKKKQAQLRAKQASAADDAPRKRKWDDALEKAPQDGAAAGGTTARETAVESSDATPLSNKSIGDVPRTEAA